jgi:hypothetical protein
VRFRTRFTVTFILILCAAAILFWALRARVPVVTALADFSQSGVQVELSLEQSSDAPCVLAARYSPLEAHFHVYSKDLPADGVDGVGRPTRLDIVSGLTAAGELTADATTSDLKTQGIDVILPVYPDAPVTLRLPVKVTGDGNAQVTLSYMACSAAVCLPPTSRTLDINLAACQAQ